jgi:hypothetical protein
MVIFTFVLAGGKIIISQESCIYLTAPNGGHGMTTYIEREIYFFKVDAGSDASGRPKSFDPIPTLSHIDKLPFAMNGRYWQDDNDKVMACWVDSKQMPCKIRLGTIRRSDFPQVEQQGEISALEIEEGSGLLEQTHIVFLGNDIAGCDFNFHGPRITRLSYYLADKAVGIAPPILNFHPILRPDVYKQLQEFKSLKMFTIKLQAPLSEAMRNIDESVWQMVETAQKLGDADFVELVLTASNRSHGLLSDRVLEFVRNLVKYPDLRYEVKKLLIKGYNVKKQDTALLDLLSDKLLVKKEILRADRRSRALSSTSAYKAIIAAFEEYKEQLIDSASLEL